MTNTCIYYRRKLIESPSTIFSSNTIQDKRLHGSDVKLEETLTNMTNLKLYMYILDRRL